MIRRHQRFPLALLLLIACAGTAAGAPRSGGHGDGPGLRLAWGRFQPGVESPPAPPWLRPSPLAVAPSGVRYLVALTPAPLDPRRRRLLESAGAEVLGYIPGDPGAMGGYRLRLDPRAGAAVAALPFVAWIGELPAHTRIAPGLAWKAEGAAAPVRIRILLHRGEPPARARGLLAGGRELVATPAGPGGAWRIEATLGGAGLKPALTRLAGLPEVELVEETVPLAHLNQDGVWVHQSFVGPSPQETPVFDAGIFGCGQVVAVSDSGQDLDSCQFRDPVHGDPPIATCITPPCPAAAVDPNQRKDIIYYNWSGTAVGDDDLCPGILGASGHGTHTSGSVAGDSSPFADCAAFTSPGRDAGDGQAPGAKLIIQEMGDGLEYLTTLGGSLWNLLDVAYQGGARIHSFSVGGVCLDALGGCDTSCTLPYDALARDVDQAMWQHPDLLVVASAANARGICPAPNAVSTPAIAKSLISAGSVGHGTAADTPSYFSSDGPVFDGRLKPTLAAQGEAVISAASDASPVSNDCGTCSLDGTSMAAPTVAGLAALVREYFLEGFHAAGVRDPSQGIAPSGALVKAVLIDGAVALGAGAPAPDYLAGYGRALLSESLALAGSPFGLEVVDHTQGLATGSEETFAFEVTAGTPLRATLVWTDYPADPGAAVARVNELMLEVVDPNGATWFQTRDGSGLPAMTSDPNAAHDDVNVEERMEFTAPGAGLWAFRVRGVGVPMGPQPFALVVRGDLAACAAPDAPASLTATPAGDNRMDLSWSPVAGASLYNVYRSYGSCPGGAWVPVATGVSATGVSDLTVSGGTTYSYMVRAASDAGGLCLSAPSPCDDALATGDCILPPVFDGIAAAEDASQETCTVDLSWSPAASSCSAQVLYNVYRGASPGFVPDDASRIASCVSGTTYRDDQALTGGEHHYIVRAEDATSGHGGPCQGGNESLNLQSASASPTGPPSPGILVDDGGDTTPVVFTSGGSWVVDPTGGDTGPLVHSASGGECSELTSPVLSLGPAALAPQLTFSTIHDLEYDPFGLFGAEGSLGQVEIAAGPGFSTWTRLSLSPGYPTPVDFPLNACTTTGAATTYFAGTDLTYDTYTADLTAWESSDVMVRFRLAADLLYAGGYWSVDDIRVDGVSVPGTCSPGGAGPPPVPDGASVPGQPLAITVSGGQTHLTWDAATCAGTEVNVYWGALGDFSTFTGGACGLAPTGSASLSIPDDVWILVANTDGAGIDGSWSRDGGGAELTYAGASAVCPAITGHLPGGSCP